MEFHVVSSRKSIDDDAKNSCFLIEDNWNDWFKYQTQYHLLYIADNNDIFEIGNTKVAGVDCEQNDKILGIPSRFERLDANYFSLGQDDDYYERLNILGHSIRIAILEALNDIAYNIHLYEPIKNLEIVKTSLMRFVSEETLLGQFNRQANGGSRLTPYNFTFKTPKFNDIVESSIELNFNIDPADIPPSNINVIIGRNGVGKSTILKNMANAFLCDSTEIKYGSFYNENDDTSFLFSNLITISYSLFDDLVVFNEINTKYRERYHYIGFKMNNEHSNTIIAKSNENIEIEFTNSLMACCDGYRKKLWIESIQTLETDQIFHEANIKRIIEEKDIKKFKANAIKVFNNFSSGHKIVLFSITKLIESLEEKSLVLIDEPETHLHPPLLAAYIRCISDMLKYRNGVAILATHSPVVVQEVTSRCVWIIERAGTICKAYRPDINTFGENLGTLTREIFGYEVTTSGFHNILKELVESDRSINRINSILKGSLGKEGAYILINMINKRDNYGED